MSRSATVQVGALRLPRSRFAGYTFPTREGSADWQRLAGEYADLPFPGYSMLPESIRSLSRNTIGSVMGTARGKATALWWKMNPSAKVDTERRASIVLKNLAETRRNLDALRAAFRNIALVNGPQSAGRWPDFANRAQITFNQVNVQYLRMASVVYGNAVEYDETTGKARLPSGQVVAPERMGIETETIVVIGIVALLIVGVIAAAAFMEHSANQRQISADAVKVVELGCKTNPDRCAQLIEKAGPAAALEEQGKGLHDAGKGAAEAAMNMALKVLIPLGLFGLGYAFVESKIKAAAGAR
jgi:uncharacterized membrane protein YecN with MAPEG domain